MRTLEPGRCRDMLALFADDALKRRVTLALSINDLWRPASPEHRLLKGRRTILGSRKDLSTYGKGFRYRFGDDELLYVYHGGRRSGGFGKQRRRAHDAVDRRVREERRAARRPSREPSGGNESGEHSFFNQALHGPQVRRGP